MPATPANCAEREVERALRPARLVTIHSVDESKELNGLTEPFIVIAGSGMATGGRVLHHLNRRLGDPRTTVLLPGYQAAGHARPATRRGGPHRPHPRPRS